MSLLLLIEPIFAVSLPVTGMRKTFFFFKKGKLDGPASWCTVLLEAFNEHLKNEGS